MIAPAQAHSAQVEFDATLQRVVETIRDISGADIVALYPYDEESNAFYAPVNVGLVNSDPVLALADLSDQINRYRADLAAGKTPSELAPSDYGTTAWLLSTRRPLVSADPQHEIGGSFVRRSKIVSLIGLPLMVGTRLVAFLYLNYIEKTRHRKHVEVTDPSFLEKLQQSVEQQAIELDRARRTATRATNQAMGDLVGDFSTLPPESGDRESSQRLETALHRVLETVDIDAGALFVPDRSGTKMSLLVARGCSSLLQRSRLVPGSTPADILNDESVKEALNRDGLQPVTVLTSRDTSHHAALLLADRDPHILLRRVPAAQTLLQTATDLLASVLNTERLVEALGETNRTLGAVARLSRHLLQPGATLEQTMCTAVEALTDPATPELNFEFANLYLLQVEPDGNLAVEATAGSTSSTDIDSTVSEGDDGIVRRMPRWIQQAERRLPQRDIVDYVARRRRSVVVAPSGEFADDRFISGYPEDLLERLDIQIVSQRGERIGSVHAARLREAADRAPLQEAEGDEVAYRVSNDITLDAEFFKSYNHGSLVRVFVPFGFEQAGRRATGILEAGFHVSHRPRLERVQIEALRASAATIAVAIETARLHEETVRRARQLEIVADVSRAIATSIDVEQTLNLVARNMARAFDASICLIALMEEDDSAWYGAAASDMEDVWKQQRVERPEPSLVFEVVEKCKPVVLDDAQNHQLLTTYWARLLGVQSLVAVPLLTGEGAIGAILLGQRDHHRRFTTEEVEHAMGLGGQAAMAISNARLHARTEEEHHIQKDVILVGFGQWGQKAYKHLVLLKNFFNFRTHVVERDVPGRREALHDLEQQVLANGDVLYWDSAATPAHETLQAELEPSCYVITYVATPAETHLPLLKLYYDLSNVVLIEKPLGAKPEEYRAFLDQTDGSVQIVAADHYWFKLEVRLLELLLTEERNLRAFLDEIEEVEIEILEEQPPGGSGAQIGMIADLIPHAFAVLSLLTPLDRLKLAPFRPLMIGCYQPERSSHETYARLIGTFEHRGREVRVVIDVGKGVANAKWIKLSGPRRMGGRRSFYKFDFSKGEAIDGTQSALRAATRPIRQPGVPDNAHLSMLRHVVEKRHPAVGILSIREALRANARIQELERMAQQLLDAGQWTPYVQGQRPDFGSEDLTLIGGEVRTTVAVQPGE